MKNAVLFLQKRSSKAGAQVALSRLLRHPRLQELCPVLVTEKEGWLTAQCQSYGIPIVFAEFPASRSLYNRLHGNSRFATQVLAKVEALGFKPRLVLGNDHGEGLLTHSLAQAAHSPAAIILRSSETTESFFRKYKCDQCALIYAVGDELHAKVRRWGAKGSIKLLNDGIYESEFHPVKPKATSFPNKILVAGSPAPDKGWADFATAIDLLEEDPAFPALDFDFTGTPPDPAINDMRLQTSRKCQFHFLGRQEKFIEFVQRYDLILHPSREESFGLAPVEMLAGGVTVLASRTGVMEHIQCQPDWLIAPCQPKDLAAKIRRLWQSWNEMDCGVAACQQQIRNQFLMDKVVADFASELSRLMSPD